MINLYSSGTVLYSCSLEMNARSSARHHRLAEAQADLEHALLLLRRHTRALPTQHAAVRLALARVLRSRAQEERSLATPPLRVLPDSKGGPVSVAAPQAAAAGALDASSLISRAQDLLTQALTLSALDGAHHQGLMREALLELAATYLPPAAAGGGRMDDGGDSAAAAAAVAAALKLAHASATKSVLLQNSSHLLTPVAVAQLPNWAVTLAKGQEQSFGEKQASQCESLGHLPRSFKIQCSPL